MNSLVHGAGAIGSRYAARLKGAGHGVSILARGKRLADIREHGIQLENVVTGERRAVRSAAVDRLDADDTHHLVLVILPWNHVRAVLPILAANRRVSSATFLGRSGMPPERETR